MTRLLAVAAALLLAPSAFAEEHKMPETITPGPAHAFVKKGAGDWTVATSHWMKPGADPMKGSGKMTSTAVVGGLGLAYAYTGDKMGEMPIFRGYGFTTWIPAKKHYESYWFDNMSVGGMAHSTATMDEKTKTMTEEMVGVGPDGKPTKFRVITVFTDDDHHTQTFYLQLPKGEMKMMEMVYTRVK